MPLPALLRLAFVALLALRYRLKLILGILVAVVVGLSLTFISGKIYQHLDRDPDRGAIALEDGAFGESYSTPVYLDQGWSPADTLWYYNTTQGSALMPYDLFVALEQPASDALFRSDHNMDRYRYLPQKPTFFNPDGLPVGFARDSYRGKDYLGFTCAACHTGQVNYQGQAIRIDGGPALADMDGFLHGLEKALSAARDIPVKRERFINRVLQRDNDYRSAEAIEADLVRWTEQIRMYNTINHSHIRYGYGRLDAFGRIYNRVLRHVINREQMRDLLLAAEGPTGNLLLTEAEVDRVLAGIEPTLIDDTAFTRIVSRLQSSDDGLPGLSQRSLLRLRNQLLNEPDAPVSYPFLWDITHSDYVQWNGLANNAELGPLGRNVGEVIGVFAKLDWEVKEPGFSLSGHLTGQSNKRERIAFTSSIDLVNLQRLEAHLGRLTSPQWPEDILGKIDREQAALGKRLYAQHCQSCHQVIDRTAWDRLVVAEMTDIEVLNTDPKAAENSVNYRGKSGNFENTYQNTTVGPLVLEATAPAVQILTSVTKGAVSTPDADKGPLRRTLDWFYVLGLSWFDNDVKYSVKAGDYRPDTTARPYQSLLAYKGRSLNGIWATAPYLHNGSVPTLYDLLLPAREEGDPQEGEYRPETFQVGSREFDPVKVGFRTEGYEGFTQTTHRLGDRNTGHEYGTSTLTEAERWALVEYLKTL
ncbi:cytochrome c [Marinimicrobium sp. C6131]|uniref:di-heme-cytochrome C peroxidase n=1 Tax=Marinimicrobium sp. C6131 TaxID=3022676 RepID=UPI00223E3F8E|nr:di-heme-cytochrome C peroxidase [Marinimicrobium sp. C6131]UZJ43702.1 cytochrome c [Marinimicrobium sp. C6131]